MLKWHKNYCLFTYIKIFSYCGGMRVGSNELIQTIEGGYLFSDPLSMWLLISMKFLIKSYQIWLYPKIFVLTLISVPNGYIAGIVYGIYQAKYYFWVLLMVKLLISTQFLIKRDQLAYIFKKYKIIKPGACHQAQKRFLDHSLRIICF